MRSDVFNACLLAGWFMLTTGAMVLNPGAGLAIGGLALIVLTVFIAIRVGVKPVAKETTPGDRAS